MRRLTLQRQNDKEVNNMKIEPAVIKETKHIGIGVASMSVGMLVLFAVAGAFDYRTVLGALLGGGFAVLNFFLMALSVQRSLQQDDPKAAKTITQNSYTRRLLLLAAVVALGIKLPWFHGLAVVVPMVFPRITILLMGLPVFQRKEAA